MAAEITWRNTDRTALNIEALSDLVRTFGHLQLPVVISFDRQISDHGLYVPMKINDNEEHYIRIGAKYIEHHECRAQMFQVISTLLHELKHAQQYESLRTKYNASKFRSAKLTNKRLDDYYSECEIQARLFEHKHLQKAITSYEQFIAKISHCHRTRLCARRSQRSRGKLVSPQGVC